MIIFFISSVLLFLIHPQFNLTPSSSIRVLQYLLCTSFPVSRAQLKYPLMREVSRLDFSRGP